MNAQRQTNTFSEGMNMDVDYSLMSDKQYKYAENIRILTNEGVSFGAMQNIEGFLACTPTIELDGETVIHTNTVREYGVVITLVDDTDDFNVYRYDFSGTDDDIPKVTKVVDEQPLGITQSDNDVWAISSVIRYESSENIKLYFTDGNDEIKMIYIDDSHIEDNESLSSEDITLLPAASLPQLSFKGFGTGSLTAGKIQYTYQLFKTRGPESALAPLSKLINLSGDDEVTDSNQAMGQTSTTNTGKSVILSATVDGDAFDRAKIISVYYSSRNDEPTITIIDDIEIASSGTLSYEDRGSSVVSELTVDEFNALGGYLFTADVIEAKDNYLFAANVTESTWDIDYDARAYRCNTAGEVKLMSNSESDLEFLYTDITTEDVPEDYDCICPYNIDTSDDYQYTQDGEGNYIYGGKGKNISYRFVQTPLVGDESEVEDDKIEETFTFNASTTSLASLRTFIDGAEYDYTSQTLTSTNQIHNYSNPEVAMRVTGYMRDEIYRFGIVFYNNQGVASPVHWIADIRMPSNRDSDYTFFLFDDSNRYGDDLAVTFMALGLYFSIENLPDEVERVEIVRCQRTVSDRTILTQGLVSCVTDYVNEDDNVTSSLVPFPYLAYSDEHGYHGVERYDGTNYAYDFDLASTQSEQYFMLVSPDLCVNREDSEVITDKFQTVEKIALMYSPIQGNYSTWDDTISNSDYAEKYVDNYDMGSSTVKVFANAKSTNDNGTVGTESSGIYGLTGYVIDTSDGKRTIFGGGEDAFYCAVMAKYYAYYLGDAGTATISDAVYAGPADDVWITNNGRPWFNATGITIGDKVYYNWAWDNIGTAMDGEVDETDANNVRKIGPHGICAIFKSNDMIANIPLASSSTIDRYLNATMLCNIRQSVTPYGGDSYAARQNSTYISTGAVATNIVGSTFHIVTYGGDTYLNIFDYNNVMLCFQEDDYTEPAENRIYSGVFFPVESTINLDLLHTEQAPHRTYDSGTGYANHYIQDEITTIGDLYSQSEPSYSYNDAYSAEPVAREFVPASMYDIDDLVLDTRIMASELKTNNEVSDSWCQFKVANYIDLDTQFGPITEMVLFHNYMLVWQQDAFGQVAINERSLITDENPGALTLGTGDILARYDYYTTKNGLYEHQLRADTQSDTTVYWYDRKRNELCAFNGQLETVSKLKGVQSYMNNTKEDFVYDPITCYDKKYNEVLFTLDGEKTLAFNEQIGAFTSFYTYVPDYYIEFSDRVYFFNQLNLYKYNGGETNDMITGEDKNAYIEFVVNANYTQTKTFDNVEYGGDFTYDTNFDTIYFETKRQISETLGSDDIDYREDTYKFCIPRNSLELSETEELANKSYKDRMKGKYLICYYKYDCNGGNEFKVPYISTAYRNSLI